MEIMETLEDKIAELKAGRTLAQLKKEDPKTYYKVKALSSEISVLKAEAKGNIITKAHLTEYRNLIIWIINKKASFKGYADVKETMQDILNEVERTKPVFLTEKSIKNIVCGIALMCGLENSRKRMIELNAIDISREDTMNNRMLAEYQSFKLNALMN